MEKKFIIIAREYKRKDANSPTTDKVEKFEALKLIKGGEKSKKFFL